METFVQEALIEAESEMLIEDLFQFPFISDAKETANSESPQERRELINRQNEEYRLSLQTDEEKERESKFAEDRRL